MALTPAEVDEIVYASCDWPGLGTVCLWPLRALRSETLVFQMVLDRYVATVMIHEPIDRAKLHEVLDEARGELQAKVDEQWFRRLTMSHNN